MITDLALLRLPFWKALSTVQRRFVWRHYVHPRLVRLPVLLAKSVLLFLFIIVTCRFEAFSSLVPSLITMVIIVFVIPGLVDLFLVARQRRDIEAYIQSHGSEIQAVV